MDQRVNKVIGLMEAGLDKQLAVADLAKAVNLSPWRLSHIFKRETQMAPVKYLRGLRMKQAKKLLESTFLSVKQVMVAVGMNDESHFVRDFETAFGSSPARFRLALQLEEEDGEMARSANI
ncbi:MAG TPA: AraC family transcriptional regulator [Blastocatellia bacterium]|nr:AraC family transcriptional regulator [Blastocatellia bacterium]